MRLLDPAAGTMTFVAEACRLAAWTWQQERGGAAVPALVREHLLPHFFGFELMMAPYAIGHLQMSLSLAALGYRPGHGDQGPGQAERVRLYLTDALRREETRADAPSPMSTPWPTSRTRPTGSSRTSGSAWSSAIRPGPGTRRIRDVPDS